MAYTTAALLKSYLGIDTITDDLLLTNLITRAQKAIDNYCGRVFEAASDDTREFTVGVDTERNILYLDEDLCAITSVKTNADAATATTLTAATDYITHPRNRTPYHAIEIVSSSSYNWTYTTDPTTGITVTGKWAWAATAPADIAHACIRLAAYYYRQKDAGVFDTTAIPDAGIIQVPQGMPRDVKLILDTYKKGF